MVLSRTPPALLGNLKVLVSDEDLYEADLLRRAFARTQRIVDFRHIGTAAEAIRYLCGEGEFLSKCLPDLVFVDYHLSPSEGGQVVTALKEVL